MKTSSVKVVYGVCSSCGSATGVVKVNVYKLGVKKPINQAFCSDCSPSAHK